MTIILSQTHNVLIRPSVPMSFQIEGTKVSFVLCQSMNGNLHIVSPYTFIQTLSVCSAFFGRPHVFTCWHSLLHLLGLFCFLYRAASYLRPRFFNRLMTTHFEYITSNTIVFKSNLRALSSARVFCCCITMNPVAAVNSNRLKFITTFYTRFSFSREKRCQIP